MSFAEILDEVEHLSEAERTELLRRLQVRQLIADPKRTAEMSLRLNETLAGQNMVTEEELRGRLMTRGSR